VTPPQLRLRNEVKRSKRTSSKSHENKRFPNRSCGFQALITVWLQVRVLPAPPIKTDIYGIWFFLRGPFRGPFQISRYAGGPDLQGNINIIMISLSSAALTASPHPTPKADGTHRIRRTGTCPTGYGGSGNSCEMPHKDTPAALPKRSRVRPVRPATSPAAIPSRRRPEVTNASPPKDVRCGRGLSFGHKVTCKSRQRERTDSSGPSYRVPGNNSEPPVCASDASALSQETK
jgi:hypothetical protein